MRGVIWLVKYQENTIAIIVGHLPRRSPHLVLRPPKCFGGRVEIMGYLDGNWVAVTVSWTIVYSTV